MQLTLDSISKTVGPQKWLYDMSIAPRSGAVTVGGFKSEVQRRYDESVSVP